jgi:hypothetical protein
LSQKQKWARKGVGRDEQGGNGSVSK